MPQLIVIKGPSTGKTIEFSGEATLGRGENNAIVIDDPSVSQHHAVLRPTSDGVVLTDCGSSNGTWCNGVRVSEILLPDGAEISVGRITFRISLASEDVAGVAMLRRPTLSRQKKGGGSKAAWAVALVLLLGAAVYFVLNRQTPAPTETVEEIDEPRADSDGIAESPELEDSPLVVPADGSAMAKYFGRVANPVTGAAVNGAQVHVLLAGTGRRMAVFADGEGKKPLSNPVLADAGGRYGFYLADGRYRLLIRSPQDELLYDHDDVMIADPRHPRTIKANERQPALSLNTPPTSGELNLPLMVQKLDENERLLGARWRLETHNTEVGWAMFYNFRRRGGLPDARDLARIDSDHEPVMTWGANDADDGIFTIPGFYISGGGLWLGDAHIATFDLRLPVPKEDDASGVAIFMNAPKGLTKGDVVALDSSGRLSVKAVKSERAKVPFVVVKVDEEERTFVMVRGLAWVNVAGEVKPGDILVTSARSRHAQADNENADPSRSLGVAVSGPVGKKVLVRISRVAMRGKKPGLE